MLSPIQIPSNEYSPVAMQFHRMDSQFRVPVSDDGSSVHVSLFAPPSDSKGIIVVSHGVASGPTPMFAQARRFKRAGYHCAVIAARGYGKSSPGLRTFGTNERHDIVKVIDALEQRGLAENGVALWGVSYGASMTLQAAIDPRVRAVVAVSPFASMRGSLPVGFRSFVPIPGYFMSQSDYDEIINRVGEAGGFDPDTADQRLFVPSITAPVLYIHGEADLTVRIKDSEELFALTAAPKEFQRIPLMGHAATYFHPKSSEAAIKWFDKWMACDTKAEK